MKATVTWPFAHSRWRFESPPDAHTLTNSITEAWIKSLFVLLNIFFAISWFELLDVFSHLEYYLSEIYSWIVLASMDELLVT